jgi:hypothetical protein
MPRPTSAGRTAAAAAVALAASCLAACQRQDETLPRRLQEATAQLGTCQKDLAEARGEVASLKQQLATALTAPARVQLTDPEIIQLVASKGGPPPAEEGAGGGLDPQKASALVLRGAQGLQGCYERALKNNVSLQKQAGVGLLLAITVKPSGAVEKVDVTPNVDSGMSECIRSTAARWKFPAFSGRAVTIEQKVTLTPKT